MQLALDRQHVDRRHVDRPDARGAPRQHRDRRDGGAASSASTSPASTSSPPTSPCRCASRAAPSSRSTPRPASGCTPTRPKASRSTSPSRSSTCSSRAAPTRASRSSAVTGTNGKTTTVRMIAHILKLMGRRVGMTTTDGIVIDGRLIKKGDMSGPKSAQMVLQNPSVDTAVFEVARGGILREGLGYDRNDVAVVTNVTGDHLGLHGIDTISQLAARQVRARRCRAARGHGRAQRRRPAGRAGWPARAAAASSISRWRQRPDEEGYDRVDGHCGRGGAAMVLQQDRRRRADRAAPRRSHDAAALHASHPGHVRRPGAHERGQCAGRGRRRLGRRRAPARHPPGPAHVQHVLLPGAGPPERGADQRLPA